VPPYTARRVDMTLRKGPEFVVAEATAVPVPRGVTVMDAPKAEPAKKIEAAAAAPKVAPPEPKPAPAPAKPATTEPPVQLPE